MDKCHQELASCKERLCQLEAEIQQECSSSDRLKKDKEETQAELDTQRQELSSVSHLLLDADSSRMELERRNMKALRALLPYPNPTVEEMPNKHQLYREKETLRYEIGEINQLLADHQSMLRLRDQENKRLSVSLENQDRRLRKLEQMQRFQMSGSDEVF